MVVVFVLQRRQLILVFLIICTIDRTVAIAPKMILLEMKNIDGMLATAMSMRVDGSMRSDLAQHQHEEGPRARSPYVVLPFATARD